jgi:hypothetical protein
MKSGRTEADVLRFFRAAVHRYEDSQVLLAHNRTTGAVYLAGYGVECGLKALILGCVPRSRQLEMKRRFRGKIGHNLEWLHQELVTVGTRVPASLMREVSRVVTWTTDLRYEPGSVRLREARSFLEATNKFLDWTARTIGYGIPKKRP